MLKASIRAAGEAISALTVLSVTDAASAAEGHRQNLIEAQNRVELAEDSLQAGHDAGLPDPEIRRREAALASAKVEVSRQEARYLSAERRLVAATDVESTKVRESAIAKRDAALAARAKAAAELDRLAVKIAEAVAAYNAEAPTLSECAKAGVANPSIYQAGGWELARNALEKNGALPSRWIGDRADQPGAAAIAERDAGAILARTGA